MQLLILLCFVIAETFLDMEEVKKALEEMWEKGTLRRNIAEGMIDDLNDKVINGIVVNAK